MKQSTLYDENLPQLNVQQIHERLPQMLTNPTLPPAYPVLQHVSPRRITSRRFIKTALLAMHSIRLFNCDTLSSAAHDVLLERSLNENTVKPKVKVRFSVEKYIRMYTIEQCILLRALKLDRKTKVFTSLLGKTSRKLEYSSKRRKTPKTTSAVRLFGSFCAEYNKKPCLLKPPSPEKTILESPPNLVPLPVNVESRKIQKTKYLQLIFDARFRQKASKYSSRMVKRHLLEVSNE